MAIGFYTKWIISGIVLLIIVAVLCYLWYQHDTADERKAAADAEKLLRQSEKLKKVSKTGNKAQQANDGTAAESNTPTAAKPIKTETTDDDEVATTEETPKVSPFGLGPYPEIPKEWDTPYLWETCETIESELLSRVDIQMHNEGIRSKYSSVGIDYGTGRITPIEWGSVLVEYVTDKNGEQRIVSVMGHPDDVPPGTIWTHASEVPSHLKIVTAKEVSFDPYEYLGLQKK